MESLLSQLSNPSVIIIALGGLALAVFVSLIAAIRFFLRSRVNVVEERMRRAVASADAAVSVAPTSTRGGKDTVLGSTFRAIGKLAKPMDEESMGRLRSRLAHAGYRGDRAVLNYLSFKILFALSCVGVLLWVNSSRSSPIDNLAIWVAITIIVGFYAPGLWLSMRIDKRQNAINHALPDALDLLVTCVESGLGLDAAVNRVGTEVSLSAPLLSSEMLQAAFEIQAGAQRGDAFRRMADRTGVEELRNLSAMVVQSEKFGTSVAKTLRVMAESMRVRRMQKAEERAATASVKMTLPLVFCIFPTLLIIIVGPAVIKMMKVFSGLGQ